MIDRGNCTFATKAYYAGLAGASLVIIADYKEKMRKDIWIVDDPNKIGKDV